MKTKFFLDFDGSIVDSVKSFCYCYNQKYKYKQEFIPADWTKVNKWDFIDQCPLLDSVEEIFDSKQFFNRLEFFPNAKEVLYELHKKYELIIVSIGRPPNISRKSLWIYENIGFIENVILIRNNGCIMNKECINMQSEGSIFLDDVASNFFSSNAERKFCYGKTAEWNMDWDGLRVVDWLDVADIFL